MFIKLFVFNLWFPLRFFFLHDFCCGLKDDIVTNNVSIVEELPEIEDSSPITELGRSSTGAPIDLEVAVIKPRFVTLKWKPPPISHGEILRYSVFYKEQDSERYEMSF